MPYLTGPNKVNTVYKCKRKLSTLWQPSNSDSRPHDKYSDFALSDSTLSLAAIPLLFNFHILVDLVARVCDALALMQKASSCKRCSSLQSCHKIVSLNYINVYKMYCKCAFYRLYVWIQISQESRKPDCRSHLFIIM